MTAKFHSSNTKKEVWKSLPTAIRKRILKILLNKISNPIFPSKQHLKRHSSTTPLNTLSTLHRITGESSPTPRVTTSIELSSTTNICKTIVKKSSDSSKQTTSTTGIALTTSQHSQDHFTDRTCMKSSTIRKYWGWGESWKTQSSWKNFNQKETSCWARCWKMRKILPTLSRRKLGNISPRDSKKDTETWSKLPRLLANSPKWTSLGAMWTRWPKILYWTAASTNRERRIHI